MKRQKILSLCGMILMLCLSLFAGAQTPTPIPLTGPTTVCKGTKHNYTHPVTPTIYYSWQINTKGYISSVTGNNGLIYWGSAGAGVLTVYGIDVSGDTVELGTANVTVLDLPEPVITADIRLACQPLVPPPPADIIPPPYPNFIDTGCQKVCENSDVTFTAHGDPSSTYTWTVSGGSASPSGNTCTVTWGPAGAGKVMVTETTVNGCEGTKSICIDIVESPIADFFAFPDSNNTTIHVCDSSEVIFVDRSWASPASPIVAWHWDFGDGTYSNAQGGRQMPQSHIYRGPGNYTATLTITNACGCTSTFSIEIIVDGQKALRIECPGVVCQDAEITYNVNTSCVSTTNWSAIGGNVLFQSGSAATIRWDAVDADGFGYVFYDGTGCPGVCPSVFVAKVPVVLTNGTIQGPDTICPDKEYMYRLPQWPTTKFNWTEVTGNANLVQSDQPNELVITVDNANAGGYITIECNYDNTLLGCSGFATKDVYVQTRPELTGPDVVCLNTNGTYTLTGTNASSAMWTLTYPDLSTVTTGPSSTFVGFFDQTGPYLLSIDGDFCPPPAKEITVDAPPPPPDSISGPDIICKGAPIKYKAGGELPGYLFNWWVENGDANAASGEYSFVKLDLNSTGPFSIHVWRESTTSPHCHSDTLIKTIDTPVLNFTVSGPDTVCPSSYQNYSVNYDEGETYTWRINDEQYGSVMQGQGSKGVQVLWNNSTGVVAELICRIRKCFGNYKEDTLKVYILPSPTAVITGPSTVCNGEEFTMHVSGNGTSVSWDMGDGVGGGSGGSNNTYKYNLNNSTSVTRTIVATVYNPNGCPDTLQASKTVTVTPGPIGAIASTGPTIYYCDSSVGQTLSVMFLGGTTASGYQWYKDGAPVGTGPTYYANQFGNYHVVLTSSDGCVYNSAPYSISYECDTCNLTIDPVVTIDDVTLDTCGYYHITASHSATGFISHRWVTSGTIVTSDIDDAYITFATAAYRQTVSYIAKYTDGTDTCEFKSTALIDVPYLAGIGVTQLCTGTGGQRDVLLSFKGTQKVPITNYEFKVGGSTVYSGPNSSFTASVAPGTNHYFEILINDGTNPQCWAGKSVYIDPLPVADFDFWRDTTCAEQAAVDFTNTSSPNQYWSFWEFGDLSTNYQKHPERVYLTGGATPKNVRLTINDIHGCTDDTTRQVPVIPRRLEGDIDIAPSNACEGQPVFLDYLPDGSFPTIPDTFYWMNDDINFATGIFHPMTVFESGYYWVRGEDHYGCYWDTEADTVNIVEVPPAFVYGDTNQCKDARFLLSGYAGSDPGIQYSWLLNGTLTGKTTALIQEVHSIPGIYTYRVIITIPNPAGGTCSDTSDPFRVRVRALPVPPGISYSITDCNDYTVELNATPALAYGTYNWSTGQNGTPVSVKTGGNFQLTYTDTFGCRSDSAVAVPKDPRVYLWIFPTGCFKICPPEVLTVTGPVIRFNQWQYIRNGSAVHAGSNSVPTDYNTLTMDGVYTLFLDNGWCNVISGNMYVEENCEGKPGRPADVFSMQHGDVLLELVPNPANDRVTVGYQFSPGSNSRWIEVYDVTGRLVSKHEAPTEGGKWELSLERFTSGIYNVMMRENGSILLYGKLSIVK